MTIPELREYMGGIEGAKQLSKLSGVGHSVLYSIARGKDVKLRRATVAKLAAVGVLIECSCL